MPAAISAVVDALKEIAPLDLAEEWDNVGLLIERTRPDPIGRVLLTIDVTDAVLEESIRSKAEMIVAYHPPIFEPVKRFAAKDRLARLIRHDLAVYSPHTALDAAPGGVNDWLADGLGPGRREPIHQARVTDRNQAYKVVVFVPREALDGLRSAMAQASAGTIGHYSHCSFNIPGFGTFLGDATTRPTVGQPGRMETVEEVRLDMVCGDWALPAVVEAIRRTHPYEEPAWEVYPLAPRPMADTGQGRIVILDRAAPIIELVGRVKRHLGLQSVRLAMGHSRRARVKSIALCAGAGGSVVCGQPADVYLTGEMRHHDILAANARGTSVILCDHTNTERGYLPVLKKKLHEKLGRAVRIDISKADREPLEII